MHNQKEKRNYFSSTVGMWYTVWWDSAEKDPQHFEGHWNSETRVKPIKDGYYAADDPQKLQDDFSYFNKIGIDYLLLDDTNNHYADGGNIAAHIDACFRMAKQLGADHAPKLCFGGGSPLLNNDEPGMIAELGMLYRYAEEYSEHMFRVDGKPLCVNFNLPHNYVWQDPLGRFTMRPAAGHTSEGLGCDAQPYLDKVGMYGWVFDHQYEQSGIYGINPGWSRSHNGLKSNAEPLSREHGNYYRQQWLKAIKQNPETIVIASWNDHAEETGIEAVELLEPIEGRGQEDPFYYQKITEGYLALRHGYLDGWYYKAESDDIVYRFTQGQLCKADTVPAQEAVILVPDDYYDWAGIPCKDS